MVRRRTFGINRAKPKLIMDITNYPPPFKRVEIKTINNRSIWSLLKEYINNMKVGDQFTRSDLLHSIYRKDAARALSRVETSVDQYRRYLTILEILKHPGRALYEKFNDIPKNLTISTAQKLAYDKSWRSWFIKLEDRK